MSFPSQPNLKGTLQQLKEIVTCLQGEDHESTRLVSRMEALVGRIESKIRGGKEAGRDAGLGMPATSNQAQITI